MIDHATAVRDHCQEAIADRDALFSRVAAAVDAMNRRSTRAA